MVALVKSHGGMCTNFHGRCDVRESSLFHQILNHFLVP